MPADVPGVTTDDHQPRPSGGDGGTSSDPAGDGEPAASPTPPSRSTTNDDERVAGDPDATLTGTDDTSGTSGTPGAESLARPAGFAPDLGPVTEPDSASTSVPASDPLLSSSGGGAYGSSSGGAYGSAPSSEAYSFGSDDPVASATPSDPAAPSDPSESGAADDPVDPTELGATVAPSGDTGPAEPGGDPELGAGSPSHAGAEPPPAPVLVPPRRQLLRGRLRGRHSASRSDRASRRGLSVNQRLWSISPWSVFKVSALFYICLGLIIIVAGTLLYNAGRSVGTIEQAESFVSRMGAYGECVATADVPEGTEFQEDDDKCSDGEVLVGGFTLDDGTLFRAAAIGVGILVVAGSIGNVLLIVLLNLLNELTGGIRHTIIKEPLARPPGSGSPRSPGGQARSPSGSPRGQPQR
jgi:hypothetical protein